MAIPGRQLTTDNDGTINNNTRLSLSPSPSLPTMDKGAIYSGVIHDVAVERARLAGYNYRLLDAGNKGEREREHSSAAATAVASWPARSLARH